MIRRRSWSSKTRDPADRPARGRRWARSLLDFRSLAGRLFLVEIVIVLLLVAAGVTAMVLQARSSTESDARRVTRGVAESFAHAPGLVQVLEGPHPSAVLEPETEAIEKAADVDSVLVFSTSFVQLTSPSPSFVGKPYAPTPYVQQTVVPELRAGHTVTFTFSTSGYTSITTAVPVFGPDGSAKGVVAVNITVQKVNAIVGAHLPVLLGGAGIAMALAAVGTALASRRLLRQTRGLGPAELARMYEHHDAVLHAVREGVVIVGNDGRLMLANDEARRLLDLPRDAENRPVADLGLDPATTTLLTSAGEVTDELHLAGGRLLALNKRPTAPYRGLPSHVVTLRDSTELHELAGRVEAADRRRRFLYEAGVAIGRSLDMTRTCEELATAAVPGFADIVSVYLLDEVTHGEEPTGTERRLRRTAVSGAAPGGAGISGSALSGPAEGGTLLPVGEVLTYPPPTPQAESMDSGRAVLVAGLGASPDRELRAAAPAQQIVDHGIHSMISVPLQVRGVTLGLAEFWRLRQTTGFEQDDLALAEELAARTAVSVDNARRYSREHSMAMTLQRSLLPSSLPVASALDVAFRYLPAQSGVGGDWFDVITLPGFRTALVVGDVIGHGVHAAAAMGRLRTAVHTFSSLDLPPDEVLGRLDELVAQLDTESSGGEISGSTCLYAVYDPVSGVCALSLAGHPGPALVSPDGSVDYPSVEVSPPLGVGGHPFQTTELRLAADSRLVLFTDGLVESRSRDLDEGLELLRSALAEDGLGSPDEVCQAVTRTLLETHPVDDVALLVARTRLLGPDQVAEWEVAMDPAAVGPVRSDCVRRLREWGLDELSFATELILSELITNAVRYGVPPVRVRLLRDTSLVCEVSDGSSTSPHLRWAATTDEGGRGIFLVAQLSQRWGTRYTPNGKVIWSEQPLDSAPDADVP